MFYLPKTLYSPHVGCGRNWDIQMRSENKGLPALLAAGTILAVMTSAAIAAEQLYQIPAGDLASRLAIFRQQAGVQVKATPSAVAGKSSRGVQGRMEAEGALTTLLSGTGLVWHAEAGGFAIEAAQMQAASVADAADGQATVLETVTVSGSGETATGPVDGYVAHRSASATKTDTPLIETPQSISVVTSDQMETMKATSLSDVVAYTPGIVPASGYSNSYDVFYSRGFRIQDGTGNIYRDGLKMGGLGWATAQQEPYGLERVELLKGASSVLFGAASPGGILNTVSKRPTDTAFREFKVESGNYHHAAVAGDVNIPLSEEWALRMVGQARNGETMVDHIPNDSLYFAPSLSWTPSDQTTLVFQAYALKRDTAYIYGVPVEGSLLASPFGRIPRNRFVGEPDFDRQATSQNAFSYHLTHDFTDQLTLRHGLRYLDAHNDVSFIGLDGWNAVNPRMQDRTAYDNALSSRGVSTDTSVEFRTETGPVEHTVLGGLDYARYTNHDEWSFASVDPLDVFNPVYGSRVGSMTYVGDFGGTISRLGVYAQDQMKLGDLTVLLGGRHDWAEDTPYGAASSETTSAFTSRAGAVYQFDTGFAPFVSFSQSFEPQSGLDNDGERYLPSRGEQYEAGIRWQSPDEMLLVSAAVYSLTQSNVLSTRAGLLRPVQTGEVRSRGFELEAKGEVSTDWSLIGSYAYTDAKVTKSEVAEEVGSDMAGVPKHQAALWLERANLGWEGLSVGAGARFIGETRDWGNTEAKVPAYVTLDARIAYEKDTWALALNASNLTNADALSCDSGICNYGDGRRVTLTLSRKW